MVWNPEGTGNEPYVVWGVSPEVLTQYNSAAEQILRFVAAHHPDHYSSFVAIMMTEGVRGEKITMLLEEVFAVNPYNPMTFLMLLVPGAITQRIEELGEDEEWQLEWNRLSDEVMS
jgi:hypothetical protein